MKMTAVAKAADREFSSVRTYAKFDTFLMFRPRYLRESLKSVHSFPGATHGVLKLFSKVSQPFVLFTHLHGILQ
ncbi:MAG: hypothetical protein CW341_06585 [Bacteroidetes bacterium]|nr:hypothetical protein [Bacteroidota bacterium]